MPASFDAAMSYLETAYLTLGQLAEASKLSPERLEALIEAGCLAGHSHEATLSLRVEARINGLHATEDKRLRYYHPDLVQLAVQADALANGIGLDAAAGQVRARHDAEVAEAGGFEPGSPAHRTMADDAWAAWRDGTFGVCLQRISAGNIVRKVLATRRLQAMLEQAASGGEAEIDLAVLDATLAAYAAQTGPFGPHERAKTTQTLIYEPALALRARLAVNPEAPPRLSE